MKSTMGRFGLLAMASAAALVAVLSLAGAAQAKTFSVRMCNDKPAPGIGPAKFKPAGAKGKFGFDQNCAVGGSMRVHDAPGNRQSKGQSGAWAIKGKRLMPGTLAPVSVQFKASGRADNGVEPMVEGKLRGGGWKTIAKSGQLSSSESKSFGSFGAYEGLRARLVCRRDGGCPQSANQARVNLRDVRFVTSEASDPNPPLIGGSLTSQPAQRGQQDVSGRTSDGQTGIDFIALRVNGQFYARLKNTCDAGGHDGQGRISLGSWHPCGNQVEPITVNTDDGARPFREGGNRLRLCAVDFAGNGRCSSETTVRVNNDCPIRPAGDTATPPAKLDAHFINGKSHVSQGYPSEPKLKAILRDAAGAPIASTSPALCTTERVKDRLPSALAAPGLRSGEKARLSRGTSRIVHVNYWLDSDRVLSQRLVVDVKPKVKLRTPGRTVHSHGKLRVSAKLKGPYKHGRKVKFKARGAGRTLHLGSDRTNKHGIARASERLGKIKKHRKLKVVAVVPKQGRYPYERGTSKTDKVKVAP